MRWRGVALTGIACLLPLVAIHIAGRANVAASPVVPEQPPQRGPGLVPLLHRQEIHPAQLAARYTLRFPLGNGSDRAVTVTGATTTCGCAALRIVPPVIPAGSWGEAIVEMSGRGRFGMVEAQIDLRTDDGRPPVVLQARLLLPPLPSIGRDEIRLPPGTDEIVIPVAGGSERFPLQLLDGPHVSGSNFSVAFASTPTGGGQLSCRLTGSRPAAGRLRLRLGYDAQHAVDLPIRIIAE